MSAKSSTFVLEMIESMELKQMTHTPYRCRHSQFGARYENNYHGMCCPFGDMSAEFCAKCKNWRASELAEAFFSGDLHDGRKATLAAIYQERMKRGTF